MNTYPWRQLSGRHGLPGCSLLVVQVGQDAVDSVVLAAVVPPPVEERGQSNQDPAEAELKVAQDVDGQDDREGLGKLNPHLCDICQRGLLFLLQVLRRQRWRRGVAWWADRCPHGPVPPLVRSARSVHSVTHLFSGTMTLTANVSTWTRSKSTTETDQTQQANDGLE